MRVTFLWVGLVLVMFSAAAATADQAEKSVDEAAQELLDASGLPVKPDLSLLGSGAGDEGGESAPVASSTALSQAQSTVVGSGRFLTKTLVDLGLDLLMGFFAGVAAGAATFGASVDTIAAAPAESAAIAAIALGVLGIASVLSALANRYGGLAAIPLFSRIAKNDLLEHKVRSQIYDLIRASPGINVSELARRLDIAWGTATHHLHKLRAEKLVGIRTVGHQKCYFPNGGAFTPREMDVLSVTKSPTTRRVAQFLVEGGARSHQEIAHGLALSPALVSFHMRKLLEAGIVERRKEGRRSIFVPLESNLSPEPRVAAVHA